MCMTVALLKEPLNLVVVLFSLFFMGGFPLFHAC
jgi:hypothetical protein